MKRKWKIGRRKKHAEAADHNRGQAAVSVRQEKERMLLGDNPIQGYEDDVLGRAEPAKSFAHQTIALDVNEGAVVGVLGPWGAGKTSFVNLAKREWERCEVPVLEFNPWMFSGAEQLVSSFFIELSAQLKLRRGLAEAGERVGEYGEAFAGMGGIPFVGPWIEGMRGLSKVLSKVLARRRGGVGRQREKLKEALGELKKPIVVVLDDIDRLDTSEIRDVFKLVRLTASFPNIVYVVAFDRGRVEAALAQQGVPGRDYLEKILQVAVDLPAVPASVMNREIVAALNAALEGLDEPVTVDEEVWPDVYMEIVRPPIRNMRDIRRYATAVHGTLRTIKGEIALADILGLEAVRVFLPDVFARLHDAVTTLTTPQTHGVGGQGESETDKEKIEGLIAAGGARGEVVRALIVRLFPAARRFIDNTCFGHDWQRRWLSDRRVAHENLLKLYLERVVGEGLEAFIDAERAWKLIADAKGLTAHLQSVGPERLEDVVASLENFEEDFRPEHAVSAVPVLMNLQGEIPDRPRGMFDVGPKMTVGRVVFRLLRAVGDPTAVGKAVKAILPELKSLSAKMDVLDTVGHREGTGHKLVSKDEVDGFERSWRAEVRATNADSLSQEREALRVLLRAKRELDEGEQPLVIDELPELTLAVLRSAWSETRTQGMGNRAVTRRPRLAWKSLVELYGDEGTLRARIKQLRASNLDGTDSLVKLADEYLAGRSDDDGRHAEVVD